MSASSSKKKDSSKVWGIFSLVAAVVAAAAARKALNLSWKAATGKPPPANPASPDVEMREALAWAAVSGTIVAVARMLATRRAAQYYARSTGHLPPGVAEDA
jgi:subtilisin family serine protease